MSARGTARRHISAWLGCSLLATAGLTACGPTNGSAGGVKEIRVGLVFPTSGSMAALGSDQEKGVQMMLDWANAHGGAGGAKIKVFTADSQSDPGVGATAAQRLIDNDQVQLLIGSYSSGIAQAILPVAQRNRVVMWEVGAVSPTVNKASSPGFFRTVGSSTTYAAADLDFLKTYLASKLGKPANQVRIAIAHEDGAFGSSVGDELVSQAKAQGLNVVATEAYPETSSDMTPVVLRLKAANPDVLFITPLVASTNLFWQAARTQDFNVKAVIGSAGFSSSAFLNKFGAKGIEGAYDVEAPAVANMKADNLDTSARTVLEQLRDQFAQQQGHPCAVHCGDGLGGAYILVKDVLPRAVASGSVTMDSIDKAAALTNMPYGSTPQGFGAKFGPNGDNTLARSYIMQWQGGKLKVVYPQTLAVADPIFPMPTWSQR